MKIRYGFWTLCLLVVASMVGAGVFTTSGFALADLGSPVLVLAAWAVGGVVAIAGAVAYGLLVQAMPESGGEYLFLSRAVHPLAGFLAGWVSLIAGFSAAIAFAALGFEAYLLQLLPLPHEVPTGTLAWALVCVAGFSHACIAGFATRFQNVAVLTKLVLLCAFLALAIIVLGRDSQPAFISQLPVSPSWLAEFAKTLMWVSLSYSGFNAAIYVASESRSGAQGVSRAMVAGTVLVTVLYLLLNTAFVYADPISQLANRPDIAAVAANAIGGPVVAQAMRVTIALCLLTSVFSMMMAAPRVYSKMAEDGLLPSWLQSSQEAHATATALQVGIASLLVFSTDLRGLLSYLGVTLSLCSAAAVAALFGPTVRKQVGWRAAHIAASFYLAMTVATAAMMAVLKPMEVVASIATLAAGVFVYALPISRSKSMRAAG